MTTIIYKIQSFFNKIRRVIKWSRIIWKTETYDFSYSIDIFKESLLELRDYMNKKDRFENTKHYTSRIDLIIKLLDISYKETYYYDIEMNKLYEVYGKESFDIDFSETENDTFTLNYIYESSDKFTDIEKKEIADKLKNAMKVVRYKEDKSKKLVWKLIEHNIENFWD
jgi:hypothetical protein